MEAAIFVVAMVGVFFFVLFGGLFMYDFLRFMPDCDESKIQELEYKSEQLKEDLLKQKAEVGRTREDISSLLDELAEVGVALDELREENEE